VLTTLWGQSPVLLAAPAPHLLSGYVPLAVIDGRAHPLGRHSATDIIHIAVGLPLRDAARLNQVVGAMQTRGIASQPLTLAEENARFNPTVGQQMRVIAWLRSHGLTVTRTYPNHLLVDAQGTTLQVERLLHVRINDYRVALRNAQTSFYAPSRNPTIDPTVADVVQSVTGLDDFPSIQPTGNGTAHRAVPYYPQDFADAYDVNPLFNAGYNGAGEHIAVTLWMVPPSDANLNTFASTTGANAPTRANGRLQVIPVDGASTKADDGEAGMDVEYTSALAPGATIDYYQSNVGSNGFASQTGLEDGLQMAGTDANNNRQISNSWAYCSQSGDPFVTAVENILASNTATGHNYFFASGDYASSCYDVTSGFYKDPYTFYPASSPYAVGVGATKFSGTVNGSYPGEVAHTYSGCSPVCGFIYPSGSGGGYSSLFARPSWQPGSNSQRGVPDVSADGDPSTGACVIYGTVTTCTAANAAGGTSLAAPLWAGLTATINSYLRATIGQPVGFLDPLLYQLAGTAQAYPPFHDITSGTNGAYSCSVGWDPVTGLGSPDGWNLARDIAASQGSPPPTATPVTPTSTPVTPTQTPVTPTQTPVTPTAAPSNTPMPPTNTPVPSATPTFTPVPAVPGMPQNLTAAPASRKGVQLTWQAPASSGSAPISGYRIYRGTASGAETLLTTVGTVLSYKDQKASSGTRYYYTVSAVNSVGEGPRSAEASAVAR
jgi:kumamolisin